MPSLLSQKALLASLSISQWSARKLDKKVTEEIHARNHAEPRAGRYNKLLIAKEGLQKVQHAAGEARTFHYAIAQPWMDDGARLLPSALFIDYANRIRDLKAEFHHAADEFASEYPIYVEDSKVRLGRLFSVADYPDPGDIRSSFAFDSKILPCPDADDFRIDIAEEHAADIRADVEARLKQVLDDAMRDSVTRVVETVGHMAARLRAYRPAEKRGERTEGAFRNSLIGNVRELARLLPAFNLTGDPIPATISNRINAELCAYDADDLRGDEVARHLIASRAESILADVQAFMQ
jgi:hypothetical protein